MFLVIDSDGTYVFLDQDPCLDGYSDLTVIEDCVMESGQATLNLTGKIEDGSNSTNQGLLGQNSENPKQFDFFNSLREMETADFVPVSGCKKAEAFANWREYLDSKTL